MRTDPKDILAAAKDPDALARLIEESRVFLLREAAVNRTTSGPSPSPPFLKPSASIPRIGATSTPSPGW